MTNPPPARNLDHLPRRRLDRGMKAILFALVVGLLMGVCGESSQPSESVDMTDTAPKKDAIAWLKKNESGKPFLMNVWFNELQSSWYENGQKKSEGNFKDGKRHGLSTWWYENGQKREESNWRDDKLMSAKAWKPNGEKCPVTNLKDGNGVAVLYNDDGTDVVRRTYKDGLVIRAEYP